MTEASPTVQPGDDLDWLSAVEIVQLVRSRAISPVEVVSRSLRRLDAIEPALNAFVTVTSELAMNAARQCEAALMRNEDLPPLAGVPVSVKDNIAVEDVPLTFGSRTRRGQLAGSSSPAVERLTRAGACIVGKTTMTEFGCKASSDSPLTGLTRNPWDLRKSAGGSSSGSAASVAAGVTPISVGTDGAGSLRIPAAFCGVFGLKAQLGRVPVFPAPTAPSLLHVGPIARTVRDAALLLGVIAGYDPRDPYSLADGPEDYVAACNSGVSGWAIAWSPTLGFADPDQEVLGIISEAVRGFERLGCRLDEVAHVIDDPHHLVIAEFAPGAATRLHDALQDQRDLMDPEVASLLEAASAMSAVDYFRAHFARHDLRQRLLAIFESHRLLVTPTVPVPAFEAESSRPPNRPKQSVLSWPSYTAVQNLTGFPAASIPCGRTTSGLPVAMQIVARPNRDSDLFAAAAAFEALCPWDIIGTAARPPPPAH